MPRKNLVEWPNGIQRCTRQTTVVVLSLEPPLMLVPTSASVWIKKTQLPCWPAYSQQVLHQR